MKRIIRTRTITKTSRRLVVCHENLTAAAEDSALVPVHCPNCGELILPAPSAAKPELTDGSFEKSDVQDGEN